jgi:hypothetical protein
MFSLFNKDDVKRRFSRSLLLLHRLTKKLLLSLRIPRVYPFVANVVGPAVIDSVEKQIFVKFVGDSDKSAPYETIPISQLLPDAFGDDFKCGDDDDVVRPNFFKRQAGGTTWPPIEKLP